MEEINYSRSRQHASCAINSIKGLTMFSCSAIGILGHSQGGWFSPIVVV